MSRIFGIAMTFILIAATLGVGASSIIQYASETWIGRDLSLRAQLAVNGAQEGLAANWRPKDKRLHKVLQDIIRDVRIKYAAACTKDFALLAETDEFPAELRCEEVARRLPAEGPETGSELYVEVRRERMFVSIVPLSDDAGKPLGSIVLLQDLKFAERRLELATMFLFVMLGTLVLLAGAIFIWLARTSWRRWPERRPSNSLRRFPGPA